jgi:hypothetical protein
MGSWVRVVLLRWLGWRLWSVPLAVAALLVKKIRFQRPSRALLALAAGVGCCYFFAAP